MLMFLALMLLAGPAMARSPCLPPIVEIPQGTTRVICIDSSGSANTQNAESRFFNYPVPIFSVRGSVYAALAVDYAASPGLYDFFFWTPGNPDTTRIQVRVTKAAFPTRVTRLGPRSSTPLSAARIARLEEDSRIKAEIFSLDARSHDRLWTAKYREPLKQIHITSVFGTKRITRRKGEQDTQRTHRGADLRICFTPTRCKFPEVRAVGDGKVIYATPNTRPFVIEGGTIILDHGQGIVSVYFHLSKTIAVTGQTVRAGDPIARAGGTGTAAAGPHLHLEIRVWKSHVDPLQFINAMNMVIP